MSLPLTRLAFGVAGLAALVLHVGSTRSQPLTQTVQFEVPVRLVDMHPDIKSLSVQCQLGPYFAREDVTFQRNYSGVVRLKSQPIANEVAASIKGWSCKLFLFPVAGKGEQPSFDAKDARYKAKAGTKLVAEVTGSFAPAIPLRRDPGLPRPIIKR